MTDGGGDSARREARVGLAYGLGAFLSWGFIALYFKAVEHVHPEEVLAHRVVWSAVFLVGWLALQRRLPAVWAALRTRGTRRALLASTTLILLNWYLFIWAVDHDRLLEASLGYFVNPLVNVLLGALVLRERLSPLQRVAALVAALGVAHQAVAVGTVPVLGLALALAFGLYGLVRKTASVGASVGLAAETLLATPLALGWLVFAGARGGLSVPAGDAVTMSLLVAAGPITAVPLLWFVHAARRLRYATVGFLQYLAPSLQFLVAVALLGEPFGRAHLVTFALIWGALALYSVDTWRALRRLAKAPAAVAAARDEALPEGGPAV